MSSERVRWDSNAGAVQGDHREVQDIIGGHAQYNGGWVILGRRKEQRAQEGSPGHNFNRTF